MVCLRDYIIILIWSLVNAHWPSPFDIRIDHYKVEITHDLVINTPQPRFSWKIPSLNSQNIQQTGYQIQLQSIKLIEKDNEFEWDSERVISSQSIHVPYKGQYDLLSSTYYRFRIRIWITDVEESSEWTKWIEFRTPIFNLHKYITENSSAIWIGSTQINMNELRKEFLVPNISPLKSAIVYISGIGYYQFYLNGNNVDPSRKLDPAWTNYEKRTLVATFDITKNITVGANAIGIKLGNGWYSQEQHGNIDYGPPRLIFILTMTFENGDKIEVVSDKTWTGREGSIKHDSIYNGEFYDSRNERIDWTRPGFNDNLTLWITPDSMSSPLNSTMNGSLILQDMLPIRSGPDALHFEVQTNNLKESYLNEQDLGEINGANLTDGGILKPIASWISHSDVQTFDLGQNMAGVCRIRFQGRSGIGAYIRFGEVLTSQPIFGNRSTRNIYTENLRTAAVTDTYVLHGDPINEFYEPIFTVHGFRYLAILGPFYGIKSDDIECLFVHSETTLKGHFVSSNPIINQIQHNIQWTQLSNLMSVPTDCNQRDERRGWMGDATLSANQALYNFDLIKFYQNFLNLIVDNQLDDGQVPNYVPASNPSNPDWGNNYPPDPNWGTALPTITWLIYQHYNDIQTLEIYYNPVVKYVNYFYNIYNRTGLSNFTDRYGDWVPPPPSSMTNRHLIASFAFLHDVYILVNMSEILGKKEDTETYSILYKQLTEEFHRVFFNTSYNFYADGMQAAQVLALALPNVVPIDIRNEIINQLINDIKQKDNHVSTGIVSTAQIYPVLSDNGHHDLALELISSITYPSYGYMFNNPYENATTMWELWNTATGEPNMDSRNQAMYTSVGAWFYSHLAGIQFSSNIIIIHPKMVSETKKYLMSKLDCQLSTLFGLIHISYTRDEHDTISNSILLRLTIPTNTQARVIFEPLFIGAQCKTLLENNQIIWSSETNNTAIQQFHVEKDLINGLMTVHIGSGQYVFQAIWH